MAYILKLVMITQVSFTADEDLKNKALVKAKSEGITLKTLFIYAMKGFVEGEISLGLRLTNNGFTKGFEDEVLAASKEKFHIGPFKSAKAALTALHKYSK